MTNWRLAFTSAADRQLAKLPLADQERISVYLRNRVLNSANPRSHAKALAGQKDFWRFRVGDYRLIAEIRDRELLILVVKVAHRREVYR